jgi:hypothetical protein
LYEKGKKKLEHFIFERIPRHFIFEHVPPEMLREGRKEGKKDMKDSEKARSSTTECVLTT